jgi:endonuclease/exonuclease/phosphatase family metal-dependent hydrolase
MPASGVKRTRVVTWNMAQRHSAGAWDLIRLIAPDLALLQEAPVGVLENAASRGWRTRLWTPAWPSGTWGSAVLAQSLKLEPKWEDSSRGAVLLAEGQIHGMGVVSVASVHARVDRARGLVAPALRETFAELRARLLPTFIVGGDLNTARRAALLGPANGQKEFWENLETWGFREPLPADGEKQSFWREGSRGALQDDHIFVDAGTSMRAKPCVVQDTPEIRRLSDHGPVVVDLADE